jgi:hypothetical protein
VERGQAELAVHVPLPGEQLVQLHHDKVELPVELHGAPNEERREDDDEDHWGQHEKVPHECGLARHSGIKLLAVRRAEVGGCVRSFGEPH